MNKSPRNESYQLIGNKISNEEIDGKLILKLFINALNRRAIKIFLKVAHILDLQKNRLNFNRLLIRMREETRIPESTLKWNIKKFRDLGLLEYDFGQPIILTSLGKLIYYLLLDAIDRRETLQKKTLKNFFD